MKKDNVTANGSKMPHHTCCPLTNNVGYIDRAVSWHVEVCLFQKCPFQFGRFAPYVSFGLSESTPPNGSSIGLVILAGLTSVSDTHTDHDTCTDEVIGRKYATHAMRPKTNSTATRNC